MARGGKREGSGRKPGSGRPRGAINQAKRDLIAMAKEHAEAALKTLVAIHKDTNQQGSARVSAATAILDRGYGKPPQFSTSNPEAFRKAIDLTDDELAAIATGSSDSPPPASLDTSKLN